MRHIKILVFVASIVLATQFHRIHYNTLRSYVASKVVKVTDASGKRGGTGFHIMLPSGKTSILTNSHVCRVGANRVVYVSSTKIPMHKKAILIDVTYTDLCLVEGVDGVSGLRVAKTAPLGEIVYQVGHPDLMPIALTTGELISNTRIKVDQVTANAHETTIPTRPGSSGSPIVNMYGHVVGVVFAVDDAYWGSAVNINDINQIISGY